EVEGPAVSAQSVPSPPMHSEPCHPERRREAPKSKDPQLPPQSVPSPPTHPEPCHPERRRAAPKSKDPQLPPQSVPWPPTHPGRFTFHHRASSACPMPRSNQPRLDSAVR